MTVCNWGQSVPGSETCLSSETQPTQRRAWHSHLTMGSWTNKTEEGGKLRGQTHAAYLLSISSLWTWWVYFVLESLSNKMHLETHTSPALTTVTASLKSPSPKMTMYVCSLMPMSSNTFRAATGSTAEMMEANSKFSCQIKRGTVWISAWSSSAEERRWTTAPKLKCNIEV